MMTGAFGASEIVLLDDEMVRLSDSIKHCNLLIFKSKKYNKTHFEPPFVPPT